MVFIVGANLWSLARIYYLAGSPAVELLTAFLCRAQQIVRRVRGRVPQRRVVLFVGADPICDGEGVPFFLVALWCGCHGGHQWLDPSGTDVVDGARSVAVKCGATLVGRRKQECWTHARLVPCSRVVVIVGARAFGDSPWVVPPATLFSGLHADLGCSPVTLGIFGASFFGLAFALA